MSYHKLIQNLGGAVTLSHLVTCFGEEDDSNNIEWKIFLNILLYGSKRKGMQFLGLGNEYSFHSTSSYWFILKMEECKMKDILILIYPYSKKIQIKDEGCNS